MTHVCGPASCRPPASPQAILLFIIVATFALDMAASCFVAVYDQEVRGDGCLVASVCSASLLPAACCQLRLLLR